MITPTIALIHHHASVRHYLPDPVPTSMVETIITAGQHASTSYNLQAYSVVAVREENERKILARLCGNQQFIEDAPVFLVWCADLARIDHACLMRGYAQDVRYIESFLVGTIDTALAAQTTALAAESLGLGICYVGSIRNNLMKIIEILRLPHLTLPIMGMTVGWPSKPHPFRPRLPLKAILHWGHYDTADEEKALQEYDKTMIARGIYKSRQIPIPGRPNEIEDYSWSEHTARRLFQPVRTDVRSAIERQGFGLR